MLGKKIDTWSQVFYKGKRKFPQPDASAHPDPSAGEVVLNADKVEYLVSAHSLSFWPCLVIAALALERLVVWTSVFFEMKIILSPSNAIFASPCKTNAFATGVLGHPSMRTGEAFLM